MDNKEELKNWQISVERRSGRKDEYFIKAASLHEAFIAFNELLYSWNLIGIHISEVKNNEDKEKKACAAVS